MKELNIPFGNNEYDYVNPTLLRQIAVELDFDADPQRLAVEVGRRTAYRCAGTTQFLGTDGEDHDYTCILLTVGPARTSWDAPDLSHVKSTLEDIEREFAELAQHDTIRALALAK